MQLDLDFSNDEQLNDLEQRLPRLADDPRLRRDAAGKVNRLRSWLDKLGLDSVLISRRDNFAWLTVGGDNRVLNNTEVGAGHLLITADKQYLFAYNMDGERILEEEIPGQGYQLAMRRWHAGDPRLMALTLGGKRIAADTALEGAQERALEINRLHEPLTALELDRCRWLGRQTALLLERLARWVQPGMREDEIARQIRAAYALKGIDLDVVIVGSDGRLQRFRHAMPSGKRIEKYASIHPAARRWGLHANVNRFICFGEPPEVVRKAHRAAVTLEAWVLEALKPGLPFAEILERQKAWYMELGYPGEWELHFQGGPTGYMVGDPTRCWTDLRVVEDQAYDWFLTVEGVQVEELALLTDQGFEVPSRGKDWPMISIPGRQGSVDVPDMWVLS